MVAPKQGDIGRCVVCFRARGDRSVGVITSIINHRVFVRLTGKQYSMAVSPADLKFCSHPAPPVDGLSLRPFLPEGDRRRRNTAPA